MSFLVLKIQNFPQCSPFVHFVPICIWFIPHICNVLKEKIVGLRNISTTPTSNVHVYTSPVKYYGAQHCADSIKSWGSPRGN